MEVWHEIMEYSMMNIGQSKQQAFTEYKKCKELEAEMAKALYRVMF